MYFFRCFERRPILPALLIHLLIASVLIFFAVLDRQQVGSVHAFATTDSVLTITIADAQLAEIGAHEQMFVADLPVDIAKEAVKPSDAEIPTEPVRHPVPAVKQVRETLRVAIKPGVVADGQPSTSQGEVERDAYARPQHHLNPPPDYPLILRQRGIEGTVWLRVRVDRSGLPEQIVLFKTSGYRLFDESALRAVARWRFKPARSQGTSMASWVEFPVRFTLQG
jgi:TonB family protein